MTQPAEALAPAATRKLTVWRRIARVWPYFRGSRAGWAVAIGATIVASHASELINEIAVIMSTGIGMQALAEVIHTYPAQSGAIMLAAQAYRRDTDSTVLQAPSGKPLV